MATKKKVEKESEPLVIGVVETALGTVIKVLYQKYRGAEFAPMQEGGTTFYLDTTRRRDALFVNDFPKININNMGQKEMYVSLSVRGNNKQYDQWAFLIQKKHAKEVLARVKELITAYNHQRVEYEKNDIDVEDELTNYTCEVEMLK